MSKTILKFTKLIDRTISLIVILRFVFGYPHPIDDGTQNSCDRNYPPDQGHR